MKTAMGFTIQSGKAIFFDVRLIMFRDAIVFLAPSAVFFIDLDDSMSL